MPHPSMEKPSAPPRSKLRPTTRIARSRRGRGHDDAHDFRLFLNAGGPPVVYRAAVSELVAILARPADDGAAGGPRRMVR